MATEEPTTISTQEPTTISTQEPTTETPPSTEVKVPSKEVQVFHCSTCGSELTPVETPTGTRYRCPQCGKIVRPIEKERRGEFARILGS